MPKLDRILEGPEDLEAELSAATDRLAEVESALFARLPFKSPTGLFKDLVVLFHERDPQVVSENTTDHENIIAQLKKTFHRELERSVTRNDLEMSKAAALEILRCLANPTSKASKSEDDDDDRGKNIRLDNSSYDSPWPQEGALGDSAVEMHGLPFAQLDTIHKAVAQAIQFTQAVRKTGLENIFRTSTSINPPSYPPFMEKLAEIYGKNRDILRILKLLGRFADSAAERRSRGVHPPTGELYDIHLGADLEIVLPSELALMSHPDAELDFFRRYSERSLMQYSRRPEPEGRGPIYVCIDNSPSMSGIKNILAKAAALFSIKRAMSEKRDASVVVFDERATAYDFPCRKTKVEELEKLLNAPLGSGTRYRSGLEKCQTLMGTGVLKNADILLIGDAEEAPTEEDRTWFETFHGWLGQTGTRLYSIHIGSSKDPLLRILRAISREVLVIEAASDVIPGDVIDELAEYFELFSVAG